MDEAVVRPARLEDAGALYQHCYPDSSLDDVRDYLTWCLRQGTRGWILRLVAEVEGQAVANVQLTIWGRKGEAGSLIVGAAYRRRRIARRLLEELIAEAKERNLAALEIAVQERQRAILAFYERLGFHPVRDKKSGLSHPACPEPVVRLRLLLRGR